MAFKVVHESVGVVVAVVAVAAVALIDGCIVVIVSFEDVVTAVHVVTVHDDIALGEVVDSCQSRQPQVASSFHVNTCTRPGSLFCPTPQLQKQLNRMLRYFFAALLSPVLDGFE